jgi:hypothetical protein
MNETSQQIDITEIYLIRITHIVNQFMQDNWAFRERLNAMEIINTMTQSMRELFSLNEFLAIADVELTRRIGQRLAIEGLAGLLSDLTPEQLLAFDEAVAGR